MEYIYQSNDIIIRREDYIPSSLKDLCNLNKENSIIVVLDQLTDQNNLGNIIRTCLLAGVNGIIIPDHSSAPITSSTASTSAGAIEILKFHIYLISLGKYLYYLKEKTMLKMLQ